MKWWEYRNYTIAKIFSRLVKLHPDKVAFHFEDKYMTFHQVDKFSNKIARYFQKEGFKQGDAIGLLLENRHEYPCIWLGLSKIGVVSALINTNLVNETLVHSIKIANCKAVIFSNDQAQALENILSKINTLKFYQLDESNGNNKNVSIDCVDLRKQLEFLSGNDLEQELSIPVTDPLLYVYTSGTTGLPKAAVITNIRFAFMSTAFNYMARLRKDDIIYNPLPLYHTAGGMVGIGQTFLHGQTVVIRKKFSASNYFSDCAKYRCTVAQYVGELCRYVLATSKNRQPSHSVRAIFGNGLRPQIWNEFVNTFGIKEVLEFYGATEGISNIINLDNTPGCVGFIPRYASAIYPVLLVKYDELTGEPIRNTKGLCTRCDINEPGIVITRISENRVHQNFKGYLNSSDTNKKIIKNVFKYGDKYFNSGDILVQDEFGNFYFKDRIGDTFRWKGENVSTTEVEGIISNVVQLNDAAVYGVEIPHNEGKAGMVAVVDTDKTLNIDSLAKGLQENLPSYAIPLFVRVMQRLPKTSTFKLKKVELQNEGYNIDQINDQIYFYDCRLKRYIDLTRELHSKIMLGIVNL
ncbi:hypothetical protein FQA39_LY14167 [Lamprigera yunnana]|nr:hypothetical protein FQA39_LY14167 [Lamprigera yunnana]